jgi:uncharacterized membrane protein
MYTLQFNNTDLEANRRGVLSETQRQRLNADVATLRQYSRQTMRFFLGFLIFVMVAGGAIEIHNGTSGNQVGYLMAAISLGSIFTFTGLYSKWATHRFSTSSIRTVEGIAHLVIKEQLVRGVRVQVRNLELKRGGLRRKFTFIFQDSASLSYFQEGERYRVYYLAYALPQALSAECLPAYPHL